ncbi:flagellar basal body-associated FliL family protein [Rhodobacteraceae bacterium KMM 6894]|nr:flagellar basal body-associated FliL family protein [Rhodobacteraceae bacterium KMM 6894]
MKKLFPLILALVGIGGGVGAGLALRPEAVVGAHDTTPEAAKSGDHAPTKEMDDAKADDHGGSDDIEFIKLNNQFVIPVVNGDRVETLVIMSLSIELEAGNSELVYRREPKLRDSFLQVLFDHANMGGFRGEFTNTGNLEVLRSGLLEVAQGVIGESVTGVLITDLARQDM